MDITNLTPLDTALNHPTKNIDHNSEEERRQRITLSNPPEVPNQHLCWPLTMTEKEDVAKQPLIHLRHLGRNPIPLQHLIQEAPTDPIIGLLKVKLEDKALPLRPTDIINELISDQSSIQNLSTCAKSFCTPDVPRCGFSRMKDYLLTSQELKMLGKSDASDSLNFSFWQNRSFKNFSALYEPGVWTTLFGYMWWA